MPSRNTDNIRRVNEAILRARSALGDVQGTFIGDDPQSITAIAFLNCADTLLDHAQDRWRCLYEDSLDDLGFAA